MESKKTGVGARLQAEKRNRVIDASRAVGVIYVENSKVQGHYG